jgi:hypothetical protein
MRFMYSLHPYLLSSMAAWIVRFLWDLFIELAAAFCCSITAVCIVLKFALVVNWFLSCLFAFWFLDEIAFDPTDCSPVPLIQLLNTVFFLLNCSISVVRKELLIFLPAFSIY